jgi:hypothetical protein
MKAITITHEGTPVHIEICLCSTFPGQGLQIKISLTPKAANAASEFIRPEGVPYCESTAEADAINLAETWLLQNGLSPLNDAVAKWAKMEQEFAAIQASENEKELAEERKLRKEGFTHKVVAWIHSDYGDDQCKVVYYRGKPSKRSLSALVRGSVVKDDYKVTSL